MRQRRGHLRYGKDEAIIHDADQHGGDQQAAPSTGRQAEVPAVELSRDDCSHAEGPERPYPRVSPELAFLKILRPYPLVGHSALLLRHVPLPCVKRSWQLPLTLAEPRHLGHRVTPTRHGRNWQPP